jgi:hypothetical protein
MKKTKWIVAQQRLKNSNKWHGYISIICEGETFELAIERIKRTNSNRIFKEFKIGNY